MGRIIVVFGAVSGLIVICTTILGITLAKGNSGFEFSVWLGYLVMLVVLSMIFMGVRRFRDQEQGGVITFARAALVGIGIAAVAGVMYVIVWEIYLAATDYAFMHDYAQAIIDERRAAGASGAQLETLVAEMEQLKTQYDNPLFRLPMTFIEIFPVGLLIALVSAAILRKSEILPSTSP